MRKLIGCVLLFFVQLSYSQLTITGVVKDADNKRTIAAATILVNHKYLSVSDTKGKFSIQASVHDTVSFFSLSYDEKDIILKPSDQVLLVLLQPNNKNFNEIEVAGLLSNNKKFYSAGTISTITSKDIHRNNEVYFQNTINQVAGVRMDSRSSIVSGARVLIRGYGSQNNNFGTGYKAYLNDIPLTDADGTTIIDDIDFADLSRIEIVKGPSSSIYGVGIGGTLLMYNKKAPDGTTAGQSLTAGSYGLLRTNTYFGSGDNRSNIYINYGHQAYDGYRVHNGSKKDFLNINAEFYPDTKRVISVYAGYTKSFDYLAGQLDSIDNISHRNSANPAYINSNAYTDIESARISLSQEYKFSDQFSNHTAVFAVAQTVGQSVPSIINKSNKNKFGARSVFTFDTRLGTKKIRLTFGADAIKNINYQKSYNAGTSGTPGSVKTDIVFTPYLWSLFTQMDLQVDQYVLVTAGLSANYSSFDVTDMRQSTVNPLYVNNSGDKHFTPLITPHVALNRKFGNNNNLYLSYTEGFSLPSYDQVFIQRFGKINKFIQPERSSSFELGTKGNLFHKSLNYQLALFAIEITNRVVIQNVAAANNNPAFFFYTNAGGATNNGIELMLNYTCQPKGQKTLKLFRAFLNYTHYNFLNADYESDNNNNAATKDYSDLQVSGVAPNVLNIGFDLESGKGFYLSMNSLYSSKMPVNLSNSAYTDSYDLVNAKAGYRFLFKGNAGRKWNLDVFGGLENMLGQRYSQMLFVNATAPVGMLPKYFDPAPAAATFYSGFNLNYNF